MGGLIQFIVLKIITLPSSFQTVLQKESLSLEFCISAVTKISTGYLTQKRR